MTDKQTIQRLTAPDPQAVADARHELGPAISMMRRMAQRAIGAGHPAGAVWQALRDGATPIKTDDMI